MKHGIKSLCGNIWVQVCGKLVSAVKNIDSKNSVLNKLEIKEDEIVDANGNLRSLTEIMGMDSI